MFTNSFCRFSEPEEENREAGLLESCRNSSLIMEPVVGTSDSTWVDDYKEWEENVRHRKKRNQANIGN